MTQISMFDACSYQAIPKPTGEHFVAGYLDGPCAWPAEAWSAFPGIRKVRITIAGDVLADVFDYEQGTANLATYRLAITERAKDSLASVVYCDLANWPAAKSALSGLPVDWWVADWTGTPHIPQGAIACQYQSLPNYDVSLVNLDAWPKLP